MSAMPEHLFAADADTKEQERQPCPMHRDGCIREEGCPAGLCGEDDRPPDPRGV